MKTFPTSVLLNLSTNDGICPPNSHRTIGTQGAHARVRRAHCYHTADARSPLPTRRARRQPAARGLLRAPRRSRLDQNTRTPAPEAKGEQLDLVEITTFYEKQLSLMNLSCTYLTLSSMAFAMLPGNRWCCLMSWRTAWAVLSATCSGVAFGSNGIGLPTMVRNFTGKPP